MSKLNKAMLPMLVALAGCSALTQEPENWGSTVKFGRIVAIYAPDAVRSELPPCLAILAPADYASRRFAKVRYRYYRGGHHEVVELPAAQSAKVGQTIELWPASCEAGQISRLNKPLAPQ